MVFALGSIAASRGYRVFSYGEIGSTSTEAARAATSGDVGEVWFASLRQTAGRGRRGRAWETASGNLAASLMIVPDCDPAVAATLGFVAGVSLNRALAAVLPSGTVKTGIDGADGPGHRIALKWPNDVLADGAKLAGILLEAEALSGSRLALVIGIGVNVVAAPEGLPYPATALQTLGFAVDAPQLFTALSDAWVSLERIWMKGRGFGAIRRLWLDRAAGVGEEVAVRVSDSVVSGRFETIDDAGRLLIRARDGSLKAITAGEIHFGAVATARQ